MWIKTFDEVQGEVVYRYEREERPLGPDEKEGYDVSKHFREPFIRQVEEGHLPPDCLRLQRGDLAFPAARAAFYDEN